MTDNQITYQIRGAIYDVYKALGPGLLESVYEEAMVYELQDVFFKQTRTYLSLLNLQVGILVNFNTDDILDDSIHRVVNGL